MSNTVDGIPEECAGCGKGGDSLKKCTSCMMVKYCSVDCQVSIVL